MTHLKSVDTSDYLTLVTLNRMDPFVFGEQKLRKTTARLGLDKGLDILKNTEMKLDSSWCERCVIRGVYLCILAIPDEAPSMRPDFI